MDKKENIKEKIVDEAKRIAKEHNLKTVTGSIFKKYSGISMNQVNRKFDRGISEVNELAGLIPDTTTKKKSDDELWEELLRVSNELKKIPGRFEFNRKSHFSDSPYIRRYSDWPGVLVNFNEWLKITYPESPIIELIANQESIKKSTFVPNQVSSSKFVWEKKKSTFYGAPMNFRGLMYEPINEQGVVFLFGIISEEMGFNVEAIKQGFPDCEGKRLVDKNRNIWERVLIEFEYESINFLQHGHDHSKCDVIVCWTHNWQDCPLEVIELQSIIQKLKQKITK